MQVGRRLAIKLLNASKFVLSKTTPDGPVTHALDRGMLTRLSRLVTDATASLQAYDYTAALRETESFFWWFCDDHIEHVKRRRAGEDADAASAAAASIIGLGVLVRLFAPILPFVSEEVWSWWQPGSVHRAPWPTDAEILEVLGGAIDSEAETALGRASEVTAFIRRQRSLRKLPFSVPLRRLELSEDVQPFWDRIAGDVLAGNNAAQAEIAFGRDLGAEFAAPASA
jgi:valyl-tRNA synthetase